MIRRLIKAVAWWVESKVDSLMRVDVPTQWTDVFPWETGECDTCGDTYDVTSRDGRCGDCGDCGHCCDHKCEKCGEPIYPENVGCLDCNGHVISVSFQGFAGSYFDQPEPAEGIIWCPICQDETDASFDFTNAWCVAHDGEVEIDDPDDDDDAYERAQDAAELRRHLR